MRRIRKNLFAGALAVVLFVTMAVAPYAATWPQAADDPAQSVPGAGDVAEPDAGEPQPDPSEAADPDEDTPDAPPNAGEADPAEEAPPEDDSSGEEAPPEGDSSGEEAPAAPDDPQPQEIVVGLGDSYVLSSEEKSGRNALSGYLDEIAGMQPGVDYVADQLTILADSLKEAEAIARAYGGTLASYSYGVGVIQLSGEHALDEVLTAAVDDSVKVPAAWPNYIYHTCEAGTAEDENAETEENYAVVAAGYNDPYLDAASSSYQYQHSMIGSVYAWNSGYTGAGIKVAVLDTGVAAHEDLTIVGSYNAIDGTANASDDNGHGTRMAGLVSAKAGNSKGGAGIAPDVELYNVKVLDGDGTGDAANIMAGIRYAVDNWKVDIINMSLGGAGYSGDYEAVVLEAYDAGVLVAAASGNESSNSYSYPANYKGAWAVGAVQENRARVYYANYGSWVDFSAPGWYLSSTNNDGGYTVSGGTSSATAVFSGTAAVALQASSDIRAKAGKAKVDALVGKMKKGRLSASGTAGVVSLTKTLGLPTSVANPKKPVFTGGTKITVAADKTTVTITPANATDLVYYSADGKNPGYKNGVVTNGTLYTGPFEVSGAAKVTVKAISVNAVGKTSPVASFVCTLKPLVSGITISGGNQVLAGKSITLKATVAPAYAANKGVTWEIAPAGRGVTVSSGGKVTAGKTAQAGAYTVTATAKDSGKLESSAYTVTVRAAAKITSVGLTKARDTVVRGDSDVTYDVAELLEATAADFDWSSDKTQVATVDANGEVATKGGGVVKITAVAKDGSGKKVTFVLTVTQRLNSVTVNGGSTLAVGKSISLTAAVAPASAANKKVDWTVAPADRGVTVNGSGRVTAGKTAVPGNYTVTATARDGSGKSDTQVVIVSDNAISAITLSEKKATIFRVAGKAGSPVLMALSATVTAKTAGGAAAASSLVEFTSSNAGVATVAWSGTNATVTATGKTAGSTVITCRALDGSGKTAKCTVTVANPASNLSVAIPSGRSVYTFESMKSADLGRGKTMTLSAVVEEEYGKVANKKVDWTSSNPAAASVNSKGVVTGKIEGQSVVITATAKDGSGLAASYDIYITTPITSLAFYGMEGYSGMIYKAGFAYGEYVLYNGDFYSTDSNVSPEFLVEVGNSSIITAVMSSEYYGVIDVYAWKKGSTTITVKAMDGSGKSKKYSVRVVP